MSGVSEGGLSAEERAQAYYEAEGWSGCAGSSWEKLTEATRDGWRHAARLAARVAAAEQRAERVEFVRGWRTYDDGSRSPVERWVRAADGDWVSLDSTRRTSGDIHMDLADPAPREYDDGGPRVREAVERAERDATLLRVLTDHQRRVSPGGPCWCGRWPNDEVRRDTWMDHVVAEFAAALEGGDQP